MGFSELLLIFVIALVVLGPQKLPKLVQQVGRWAGKARAMARQFREQLENEINIEELNRTQPKTPPPPMPEPTPAAGAAPVEPWNTPVEEPAPIPQPAPSSEVSAAAAAHAGVEPAAAAPPATAAQGEAAPTLQIEPAQHIVSEGFEHTIHAPPPPPETLSSTPIVETHERGS